MARSVRNMNVEHLSLCMPDGILLGQREQPHDLFVAHTFITYEMASGLQAEDFAAHRQHILTDREMYDRAKLFYY